MAYIVIERKAVQSKHVHKLEMITNSCSQTQRYFSISILPQYHNQLADEPLLYTADPQEWDDGCCVQNINNTMKYPKKI